MQLLNASQELNVLIGSCICLPFLLIAVIFIYSRYRYRALSRINLKNKHIIITGGSSGIGKSLACEVAKRGGNVTLIARNEERLAEAKEEVNSSCVCSTQRVHTLSLDISNDFEEIEKAFVDLEQELGPPFMLINCAGTAVCGKLEDTSVQDIKKMFQLNCLGSIYPTKAVVEKMKSQGFGYIVLVASEAAFVGIFGLSVYSASKFALRGFAEALNMEVRNYGVKVTVAYPPDTDTPGFVEEEKTKPQETRLISQTSGLWKPEEVAKQIVNDALAGYFTSTNGLDGFLLSTVCAGVAPSTGFINLLLQVLLMGTFRIVSALYQLYFQWIVKKCVISKNKLKKTE